MKYRAEIDGLRAIAVLPVIFFHAGFALFNGGFIGVDVFFVISGYLITSILIDEISTKRFSFITFYERRARRILPALVVVTLVTTLVGWLTLNPFDVHKLGNGLIGVSTFSSNFIFWLTQGYFVESAELNPLIHTWSLAVEEQYYFVFPILLFFGWRLGQKRLWGIILLLSLISLIASEVVSREDPLANFYLPMTRAWELLSGSLAAYLVYKNGVHSNQLLSLLGLLCIFFAILIYDKSTPFPSTYSLLPVVGSVLIILFADEHTYVAKFLKCRLLVGLGLISYSTYLWHQPILSFTRLHLNKLDLEPLTATFLIFICIILSYLSWKYIETPFRKKERIKTKQIFIFSIASLLSIGGIGLLSKQVSNNSEQYLAEKLSESKYVYFSNLNERKFLESRLYYPLRNKDTLIVGSSRVMEISSSLLQKESMNLSVSGASIEDIVMYTSEGVIKLKPNHVIIGVDPWLFNMHDNQERWRTSEKMFKYWNDNLLKSKSNTMESFFSLYKYTPKQTIAQNIYSSINNQRKVISYTNESELVDKKAYDGSHIYNNTYSNLDEKIIEQDFSRLLQYSMEPYTENTEARIIFEKLIQRLKNNNIDVTLTLTPYHPKLFQRVLKEKPIYLEMEDNFHHIAKEFGINIIGSYNPSDVGCKENEFYDGMHPKRTCMKKLFKNTKFSI